MSNLAFVFRNIFSKRGMKGKSVGGMNYYACLSMLSLVILTPFAIAVEGPQLWAVGWQRAVSQIGPNFIWYINLPQYLTFFFFFFSFIIYNICTFLHYFLFIILLIFIINYFSRVSQKSQHMF